MTTRERSEAGEVPEATTAPQIEPYASIRQVADALGLHYNTVWEAVRSGRLPAIRVGRSLRIRVADIGLLREDPGARARDAREAVATRRPPAPRQVRGTYSRKARGLDRP